MKPYRLVALPVVLLALCFIPSSQSRASGGGGGTAINTSLRLEVDFDDGGSITLPMNDDGTCDQVGLQPGQTVNLTVSVVGAMPNGIVLIEPTDGGCVLDPNGVCQDQSANQVIVQNDQTVSFTFQAGCDPGTEQISLHDGSAENGVKFWVFDPNDTVNVPPVVTEYSSDDSGN